MPSITKIKTENIKGLNQQAEISPKTIFHGGNGKGKSSILDAIKLSLLGEHDVLGKQGKKLITICGGNNSAYAEIQLTDGTKSGWSLKPYGDTAKTESWGTLREPSLRLNLCPDEFWGKGDTARMKTLLDMCGDSSLVTKDFITECLRRIRVKGMEEQDLDVLDEYVKQAEAIITDNDISTLAKLESLIAEDKASQHKNVRQWKTVIEAQDPTDDKVGNIGIDESKDRWRGVIEESKQVGKELALAEKAEREKIRLMEKRASSPSKQNEEKVNELNRELVSIGKELKDLTIDLTECTFTEVGKDSEPNEGDECFIRASAVWDGKKFKLDHSSVKWCKVDEEKFNELNNVMQKLTDDAQSINILITQIEAEPNTSLTDLEEEFLNESEGVNYEQVIAELNSKIVDLNSESNQLKSIEEKRAMLNMKGKVQKENQEKYDESVLLHSIIKKAHETIRDLQNQIVNSAIESALKTINKVTRGIIKEEIVWDGVELGKVNDKGWWVSANTFSGAEKAVTRMGLGVALASKSNFKLAIIDEVSRLDLRNTKQLLLNLDKLVDREVVDQYIVFCLKKPQAVTGRCHINIEDTTKRHG